MLKDTNSIRLSGTVFWSKLDDRQSFSMLRVGIKLNDGTVAFATISNPNTKSYESLKPGNKIILNNAWLDIWQRQDGREELQLKAYDSHCQFFAKDVDLPDLNEVTLIGKVISYTDEEVFIEMLGERNPKTGQYASRRAIVKIGDQYKDIKGKKIFLQAKIASVDIGSGKTRMVIAADYNKINIF